MRNTLETTTTTCAPPPRPTKQKNGQQHRMQPPIADPAQPLVARVLVHGAPTPQQIPLAQLLQPKQRWKQTPSSLGAILSGNPDPHATHNSTKDRVCTDRTILDSWENYIESPIIWIDAGPYPSPTPGYVVQWFSFTGPSSSHGGIRSPSISSDHVASTPSHVSNSLETSSDDSLPRSLVPCRRVVLTTTEMGPETAASRVAERSKRIEEQSGVS